MEQMISNIWNMNALLSGIIVFVLLIGIGLATIVGFIGIIFKPFTRKYEE